MDLAITIGSLHFSTLEILCIIMCPSYPETEEEYKNMLYIKNETFLISCEKSQVFFLFF
jgi:hypothetical protein